MEDESSSSPPPTSSQSNLRCPRTSPERSRSIPEHPRASPERPRASQSIPEHPQSVPERRRRASPEGHPQSVPPERPGASQSVPERPQSVPEHPQSIPERPQSVPERPQKVIQKISMVELAAAKNYMVERAPGREKNQYVLMRGNEFPYVRTTIFVLNFIDFCCWVPGSDGFLGPNIWNQGSRAVPFFTKPYVRTNLC